MNTNFITIIKRIIAEQGEAILGDPQRLKSYVKDYAAAENKDERIAFGRCIEYGAYTMLKKTAPQDRAAAKSSLAQRVHSNAGVDITLCSNALDVLEMALFGGASVQRPPQSQSAYQLQQQQQSAPPAYHQPHYYNPSQTPPGAKKKNKNGVIVAALVIAILAVWGISRYMGGANPLSALDWRGFKNFESLKLALHNAANEANLGELYGELFGENLTEEGFAAALFLGALFSSTISLDTVSGDTLTERYDVPAGMRKNYNYLVKRSGSTTYLAMFISGSWSLVSMRIEE